VSTNQLSRKNRPAIHPAIFLIAVLLAFFAAYAHSQQIHQISFNGSSWMDQNLNGALASGFTGIAAFQTVPNQQTHVYYVDNSVNYDVHQLFYNGTSWSDEDLTVVSGAARGAIGPSAVAGFPVGNFQYVYYIGSESDVHQLLYDNARWTDTDLSATAGGPTASARSPRYTRASVRSIPGGVADRAVPSGKLSSRGPRQELPLP
jgi:hypothetical protein